MDCCGKIGEVISKIMDAIKPILAVVLLAVAAYYLWWAQPGAWASMVAGMEWMPAILAGASNELIATLAFGAALVVSPETVVEIASQAAKTVGSVASKVVAATATGLAAGLFGENGLALLIGAAVLYFFLTRDKAEKEKVEESVPVSEKRVSKTDAVERRTETNNSGQPVEDQNNFIGADEWSPTPQM